MHLKRIYIFVTGLAVLSACAALPLLRRASTAAPPALAHRPGPPAITFAAAPAHRVLVAKDLAGRPLPRPASASLATVLDASSGLRFEARLDALHSLRPADLGPADVAALLAHVAAPRPALGLSPGEDRAFKNDLLNLVGQRPADARAVAATLRQIYTDAGQDPALRDYALQHLANLVEHDPSLGWQTHLAAVASAEPALAATALLHLAYAHEAGRLPGVDVSPLGARALALAADETIPAPTRATALQVCARIRHAAAAPTALRIAQDVTVIIPLRIAALASLGRLGGAGTELLPFLHQIAEGPDLRLRPPARAALLELSQT